MHGLRTRLTYANVMATIAVFLALGGVSWAAAKLGKNAVKGRNIAKGAVGTRAVLDRSLLARDFKPGQLAAGLKREKGLQGPQGPQGAAGTPGPAGAPGSPGREGSAVVASTAVGPFPVPGSGFADLPFSFRWTQPAGAYDELRGELVTTMPSQCLTAQTIQLQVVRDGNREISPDTVEVGDAAANGAPDNTGVVVHDQKAAVTSIERQALPVELPYLEPPATATERVITVRAKKTGCTVSPEVTSIRFWVLRSVAG